MKLIIKNARVQKRLLIRDVAFQLQIDAALVSKWEKGTRKPTREQVVKLAQLLDIDTEKLLIEWMSEIVIYEIGEDDLALKAMVLAEKKLKLGLVKTNMKISMKLEEILSEIEEYKQRLDQKRGLDSYRIAEALELEYTYESNRIEGNTLTLKETDLVINEGITISGKSMREHLEAINHKDALSYLKDLVTNRADFRERDFLQLHQLILRGIDIENAGKYRRVQVMIKGSMHTPPQPFLVAKQMEDLFFWYEMNKRKLHPILLAAEVSERIVTIHPFIDGNGRTSRLIMNLILLRHGYVIANIKGDFQNRMQYYEVLENAQINGDKNALYELVARVELESLKRYLDILNG